MGRQEDERLVESSQGGGKVIQTEGREKKGTIISGDGLQSVSCCTLCPEDSLGSVGIVCVVLRALKVRVSGTCTDSRCTSEPPQARGARCEHAMCTTFFQ